MEIFIIIQKLPRQSGEKKQEKEKQPQQFDHIKKKR